MCNYQGNITKKNWTEIRWFYLGILKEQSDVKTSLSLEKSEKKLWEQAHDLLLLWEGVTYVIQK